MGMEFELKYAADPAVQEAVRQAYPGQWRAIAMETTYYDTPAGDLSARCYTLRRRLENGVSICTFKTPAGAAGRGEWECACDSILDAVAQLQALGGPREVLALTKTGLIPICGARFTRQALLWEAEQCSV